MHRMNLSLNSLFLILATTSCSTIMQGPHQYVGVSSNPSHASVWVDKLYAGNTPIVLEMTRYDHHIVSIHLEGYQPYEVAFAKKVSGWVFGNVVFGGFIGLAVDAVTGSLYKLTPEQIQADMLIKDPLSKNESKDFYIAVVLNSDPSWEKIGTLTR